MFGFLPDWTGTLLDGFITTLELTIIAGAIGVGIAIIVGSAMLARSRVVRFIARTYTEIFRGMSEIVLLFIFVVSLPGFGINLPLFPAALIALSLNIGAYEAEVVRGAVQAVPRGQREAAIALNMSPLLRLRRVILPQAAAVMIGPVNVLTIQLMKATALVSIVGINDFVFSGDLITNLQHNYLAIDGALLIGFFLFGFVLNRLFRVLERRYQRGRTAAGPVKA